jgi:hypothetical protein
MKTVDELMALAEKFSGWAVAGQWSPLRDEMHAALTEQAAEIERLHGEILRANETARRWRVAAEAVQAFAELQTQRADRAKKEAEWLREAIDNAMKDQT